MSYWIKTYTEILNDPKIGRLPDDLKWRFMETLLLVGSITPSGETGDGLLPAPEDCRIYGAQNDRRSANRMAAT